MIEGGEDREDPWSRRRMQDRRPAVVLQTVAGRQNGSMIDIPVIEEGQRMVIRVFRIARVGRVAIDVKM